MRVVYIAVLVFLMVVCATTITITEENTAKTECKALLTSNSLPGFVRLAFHDCVGGCDGCINHNMVDSLTGDVPNAGLRGRVRALETVYDRLINDGDITMSRADFWAVCAHEAIQEARLLDDPQGTPVNIVLRYGRVDCPSNNGLTTSTDNLASFPNPRVGSQALYAWCLSTFNFDTTECLAIMGAHTLGRARGGISGYQGPWVRNGGNGTIRLNNEFYSQLANIFTGPPANNVERWVHENVAAPTATGSDERWQFAAGNQMMLNTDMCLHKDISPDSVTGEVTQSISTTTNSPTAVKLLEYAGDNQAWIDDFGPAFEKMIERGYTNLVAAV